VLLDDVLLAYIPLEDVLFEKVKLDDVVLKIEDVVLTGTPLGDILPKDPDPDDVTLGELILDTTLFNPVERFELGRPRLLVLGSLDEGAVVDAGSVTTALDPTAPPESTGKLKDGVTAVLATRDMGCVVAAVEVGLV